MLHCRFTKTSIYGLYLWDFGHKIMDVDIFFKGANVRYIDHMTSLDLIADFNFKTGLTKRLYTHFFFLSVMDFLKSDSPDRTSFFYSNSESKDPFRNSLVKKFRTIFGFLILETSMDLEIFSDKLQKGDCDAITRITGFFASEKKNKRMKTIRKALEKEGMTFLHDSYFEELQNKRILYC